MEQPGTDKLKARIVKRITKIMQDRVLEQARPGVGESLEIGWFQELTLQELNTLLWATGGDSLQVYTLPITWEKRAAICDYCFDLLGYQ